MPEEAQHVYNVSWGKLMASKAVKGGMTLRKTLMVSGVLIKAKSAILSQSFCEYREPKIDSTQQSQEKSDAIPAEENSVSSQTVDTTTSEQECSAESVVTTEEQDSPVVSASTPSSDNVDSPETPEADKENLDQTNNSSPADCQDTRKSKGVLTQCNEVNRKRTLEPVEQTEESPKKKVCTGTETEECYSEEHEPMDCTNISSLVARFSTGFTGLLADCENSTPTDCSSNNVESDAYSSINSSGVNYSSGLSEGFSSCSTQIKESFDALSSTPIFLAV